MMIQTFFQKLLNGSSLDAVVKRNVLFLFLLRGISVFITFLIIPLTINYLNESDYGIWLTLSSIVVWVDFFDFGLGHGLRNKLTQSISLGQDELSKKYVSTTYAVLIIISVLFFLIFFVSNLFLDWRIILNDPKIDNVYLGDVLNWTVALFCIRFVTKTIGTVLAADQKVAFDSLFAVLGNVMSVFIIYSLTVTTEASLKYVAIGLGVGGPLIYLICSIVLFSRSYRFLKPDIKYVDLGLVKELMALGVQFFIIQLSNLLIFTSTNFLIIRFFGSEEVTVYNVVYKYFSVVTMIFVIVCTPLWTAFTKAFATGDLSWIRSTTNKLRKLWLISIALTIVLLLTSKPIINFWIGREMDISYTLLLSMSVYTVAYNWLSTYNYVVNGSGKLAIQTIHSLCAIVIYFPLAYFLMNIYSSAGVILATTVVMLPLVYLSRKQYMLLTDDKATGIWNQ